jgi:hypothetical protein
MSSSAEVSTTHDISRSSPSRRTFIHSSVVRTGRPWRLAKPMAAASLEEWFAFLESVKGVRLRSGGVDFAGSPLVFPGRDGAPFSNQAFNARIKLACERARCRSFPPIPCGIQPQRCCSTSAEPTCVTCRSSLGTRVWQQRHVTLSQAIREDFTGEFPPETLGLVLRDELEKRLAGGRFKTFLWLLPSREISQCCP